MAYDSPGAIVASMPVPVSSWPAFSRRQRAAKCVLAPQSSEITASSGRRSLRVRTTICGRNGDLAVVTMQALAPDAKRILDKMPGNLGNQIGWRRALSAQGRCKDRAHCETDSQSDWQGIA
jgi:hypothetical protein